LRSSQRHAQPMKATNDTPPWNDLQYLYFIGYAFWNYFTTPFLLASNGVVCEEAGSWEENHQKWRVLKATFDPSIDTHCAVPKFYFDEHGMIQRHDYFTDVAKGNVAHYCMDYKSFDGFVFPTRRRVVSRGESEFTATGGPSSVLIDVESVVVDRQWRTVLGGEKSQQRTTYSITGAGALRGETSGEGKATHVAAVRFQNDARTSGNAKAREDPSS
jgi:hypothetical protein